MIKVQILSFIVSVALILFVLVLIKKRKLKEEYGLLWLFTGVVIAVFSAFRNLLEILGDVLGIFYSPAALLLVAVLFILLILLHFSVVISSFSERIKVLTQKVAQLEEKISRMV
jgi:hypothetical protein